VLGTTILEGSCLSFKPIRRDHLPSVGIVAGAAWALLEVTGPCARATSVCRCKPSGAGACREYPRFRRRWMVDTAGEQAGAGLQIVAGLLALGMVAGLAARLIPAIIAVPAVAGAALLLAARAIMRSRAAAASSTEAHSIRKAFAASGTLLRTLDETRVLRAAAEAGARLSAHRQNCRRWTPTWLRPPRRGRRSPFPCTGPAAHTGQPACSHCKANLRCWGCSCC